MAKLTVEKAIEHAEALLPGEPALEGEQDPRWQAIIEVGEFIHTHPEEVWAFTATWGCHDDEDTRTAVAVCLLEHLLEYHFYRFFSRTKALAMADRNFAFVVSMCGDYGLAKLPNNAKRMKKLQRVISRKYQ